jgi:hypothetical protein
MTHKFVNFNQEKKFNTKRSSALTGGAGAGGDGPPMRWAGQGGALLGGARPGGRQALLGWAERGRGRAGLGRVGRGQDRAGRAAGTRNWTGRAQRLGRATGQGTTKAGPGRVAGARCWAGRDGVGAHGQVRHGRGR